jgi:hypothetical protein
MKTFLLSAALVGAGLMISGPVAAQNINKGSDPNATNKERSEMGASSAGSTARSTPSMHNDATTGLSSAKKQHEEANTSNLAYPVKADSHYP